MPDPVEVHTEPFVLHLELQWDGGTLAEFESNFRSFSWDVPRAVYFAEPMSGFGAHLALNAFETTIGNHSGDLVHVLAGGIAELHGNGSVDLGVQGQIDFRAMQLSGASIFLGVQGQVTANPAGGAAEVTFAPTLSIQFGATAHP
ncbi:MAG: hypothetical protein M3527_08995 [Actinomycetota bacterium]|nr:hypothetical protein [Acidimicrobiia bacterium]MDQ3294568.1 hypothetical protein [Actinomycetota bacterium]